MKIIRTLLLTAVLGTALIGAAACGGSQNNTSQSPVNEAAASKEEGSVPMRSTDPMSSFVGVWHSVFDKEQMDASMAKEYEDYLPDQTLDLKEDGSGLMRSKLAGDSAASASEQTDTFLWLKENDIILIESGTQTLKLQIASDRLLVLTGDGSEQKGYYFVRKQ